MSDTINQTLMNATQNVTQVIADNASRIATASPTIVHQQLLPWFPDWFTFVLLGVIGLIIFFSLPIDVRQPVKKFLTTYGFFIIVGILWLYFRGRWGLINEHPDRWPAPMNSADFYAGLTLLVYFLGVFGFGMMRYKSRQFIGDGVHGSFGGMPQRTKDGFLIFSLDGIEIDNGLKFKRGKRIIVLREETGQFIDECFVSVAHFRPVTKERLPVSVRKFTDSLWHFKRIEEIYYGWYDAQHEKDWDVEKLREASESASRSIYGLIKKYLDIGNPTMETFLEILETESAVANNSQDNFDVVVEDNEKKAGHLKRMRKMYGDDKQKKVIQKSDDGGGE